MTNDTPQAKDITDDVFAELDQALVKHLPPSVFQTQDDQSKHIFSVLLTWATRVTGWKVDAVAGGRALNRKEILLGASLDVEQASDWEPAIQMPPEPEAPAEWIPDEDEPSVVTLPHKRSSKRKQ